MGEVRPVRFAQREDWHGTIEHYPGIGRRVHVTFPNGRGASVVDYGYGRGQGLFEVAVLDADGDIDYSTPITSDVVGHLTPAEVLDTLDRIAALSPERTLQSGG